MATSSSSSAPAGSNEARSNDLTWLRTAVRGDGIHPGLATVLPMLQTRHRRELRREEHWSKEELVRHPDPRQLIRAMRKPGNLDEQRRPVYTLDERRYVTADIRENRYVRTAVGVVRDGLEDLAPGEPEAERLLRQLDEAIGRAPYLNEVGGLRPREHQLTTTMLQDPLYRAVVATGAVGERG